MSQTNCMKKYILSAIIFAASLYGNAQSSPKAYFGLGAGLDYGGIGIKAQFKPTESIGIFGGVGYNLYELGYNAGASYHLLTDKKVSPFFTAMYGYNGVIKIQNRTDLSKAYFGPTIGVGCDIFNRLHRDKLTLELLVPFRSSEFKDHYDALKAAGVQFNNAPLPIAISIGYNFSIGY